MAMARAVWGFIERRDHRLMRKMNRWPPPRWVRYWMIWATRAGDSWLWYGLGVMILLFGGPRRFPTLGAAGFAAAAGIVLDVIIGAALGTGLGYLSLFLFATAHLA